MKEEGDFPNNGVPAMELDFLVPSAAGRAKGAVQGFTLSGKQPKMHTAMANCAAEPKTSRGKFIRTFELTCGPKEMYPQTITKTKMKKMAMKPTVKHFWNFAGLLPSSSLYIGGIIICMMMVYMRRSLCVITPGPKPNMHTPLTSRDASEFVWASNAHFTSNNIR